MINTNNDGLRKAAILVASLDGETADLLLSRLEPGQVELVRRMAADLGPVDAGARRRIVDEFFRMGGGASNRQNTSTRLDNDLASKLATAAKQATGPGSPVSSGTRPFSFMAEAQSEKLATLLASERSQTIALVISHLPPEQAGSVLVHFPPALQTEIVHRLVDLEETDPEVLAEVEQALSARFFEQIRMHRRRVAGLPAVAGILSAADARVGAEILENLAAHDSPVAHKLRPAELSFDDLLLLDDLSLATVLRESDPEVAILALVGAQPRLIERILSKLPDAEARIVRHRLDHLGPTRLSDVEEARRRITEVAQGLAAKGEIDVPDELRAPIQNAAPASRFVCQA
jgi:flagellar motor switch protein FliG